MKISILRTPHPQPQPDASALGFGRHFADHMFVWDYDREDGWKNPRIEPIHDLGVGPGNLTLHYGQTIFEGLKAFRWKDGSVILFRPQDHVERFRRSARRLCIPDFNPTDLLSAFKTLVDVDRRSVPSERGTALYLRPTIIASDDALGVRPSHNYTLFIVTSPVGAYYSRGSAPTRILVEERYSRAAYGGLGEAKTGANYAASLLAAEEAKAKGFDQVLWLDAKEHEYVEEVGTMNIFFVIDGTLITPPLGGTILDGITRRTVLTLARDWGVPIQVRPISMTEIGEAHAKGLLQEAFGSGTAAVISPVGELFHNGAALAINEKPNSLRERLYTAITGLQYGEVKDSYDWVITVPPHATGNGNGHGNGNGKLHTPIDEAANR